MMNLGKHSLESDNNKVVDPKDLKEQSKKVKRKRTLKIVFKSNHGWCIDKCAMGQDAVAKPLDNDSKLQFSEVMDLTSELQGFSRTSGVILKEMNDGSCNLKRVQCPNVSTLPIDSIIKTVNPSVKKYQKMRGASSCLNEDLAKFAKWPEIIRKKRSSASGLNQGSVRPGKRQKAAREKIERFSTPSSLPEEVVEEILSRLPVKSLARFRCVRKSWRNLTYSERFISLHLKNRSTTQSQFFVGTCSLSTMTCSVSFLPPPLPIGGHSDSHGSSQEMVEEGIPNLFGGSCNGIVCFYSNRYIKRIVLWNPATNEFKKIQTSGFSPDLRFGNRCAVGFGFDPKTNDYKILNMVYGELDPPVAQLELYSLRKGSWKVVDSHKFLVAYNHYHADVTCSLPFTDNRIVCAVVSPLSGTSKWEILAFDMSTETYEIIPVPPLLDAELGDYGSDSWWPAYKYRKTYFKLFPFKNTIALGIVHRVGNGSYCDIWVLNDFYSTRRQSRSWSKFLSTSMNDGVVVPIGCWGASHVIFQDVKSRRLLCLDLDHGRSNMMADLGAIPRAPAVTSAYEESLVRINDTKCRLRTYLK